MDQSDRLRFQAARKTASDVLERSREERRSLAIKGYCNYRLGVADAALYDQCLRDFQAVLDVAAPEGDPVRAYVAECRRRVIHWMSLEEKVVPFSEAKLSSEWTIYENYGIRVGPDEGWLVFKDTSRGAGATQDGSPTDPTVVAKSKKLFTKDTLEILQAWVSIPKADRDGAAVNNVTFGVAVQPASGDARGLAKNQGIGLFYDKGKVAVRVGGGSDPLYKDGEIHRVSSGGQDVEWPDDPTGQGVLVEIERADKDGSIVVRLGNREILKDKVPAFKQAKGDAELWLGGWSNKAQNWNLRVDKIRIVRRKS
jgi:hypothetical protein